MTSETNPLNLKYDKKGLPRFKCRRIKCRQICETNKDTLCERCKSKDKSRKRRILKNQRAIGIRTIRKKKKPVWKTKQETVKYSNKPITPIYAKRLKMVILLKSSLNEKWKRVSRQKYTAMERKHPIIWNPIEKAKEKVEV